MLTAKRSSVIIIEGRPRHTPVLLNRFRSLPTTLFTDRVSLEGKAISLSICLFPLYRLNGLTAD